jgi:MinD superfamily P-loop ATPase
MTLLPFVDARTCTGCGDCVVVCPTNCLALAGSLPWLARPADCLSCELCKLICPTDAIRMVDVDLQNEPRTK